MKTHKAEIMNVGGEKWTAWCGRKIEWAKVEPKAREVTCKSCQYNSTSTQRAQ